MPPANDKHVKLKAGAPHSTGAAMMLVLGHEESMLGYNGEQAGLLL